MSVEPTSDINKRRLRITFSVLAVSFGIKLLQFEAKCDRLQLLKSDIVTIFT